MASMSTEAALQESVIRTDVGVDYTLLVDLIYEATLDSTRWLEFAERLSEVCGGAAVALGMHFEGEYRGIIARSGFVEDDAEIRILRHGVASPFAAPDAVHGEEFAFMGELPSSARVEDSEYYRRLMAPSDLAPEPPLLHLLGTTDGVPTSVIGIYRKRSGAPLAPSVVARCNALVPHLARAFRVVAELQRVRDRRIALAQAIDRFPTGVFVVDAKRRCILSNQCANETAALGDGLIVENRRVSASFEEDSRRLREAIGEAMHESSRQQAAELRIVALRRPSGEAPLQVMVAALSDVPPGSDDRQPIAALFVPEPGAAHVDKAVLRKLYSLTPSEAAFVAAFVAERNLEEAASARGIRTSTARGYLKTAYQKTGTNSQHGLMHLLLTGVGRIRNP